LATGMPTSKRTLTTYLELRPAVAESCRCSHLGPMLGCWLIAKIPRGSMRKTKTVLLVLLTLLALLGAVFIVLANIGDASVVAATGGVYGALESAGVQDNVALRDGLYATVLRLKEPWAAVNLTGFIALLLSVVAVLIVWRKRE